MKSISKIFIFMCEVESLWAHLDLKMIHQSRRQLFQWRSLWIPYQAKAMMWWFQTTRDDSCAIMYTTNHSTMHHSMERNPYSCMFLSSVRLTRTHKSNSSSRCLRRSLHCVAYDSSSLSTKHTNKSSVDLSLVSLLCAPTHCGTSKTLKRHTCSCILYHILLMIQGHISPSSFTIQISCWIQV